MAKGLNWEDEPQSFSTFASLQGLGKIQSSESLTASLWLLHLGVWLWQLFFQISWDSCLCLAVLLMSTCYWT